MALTSVTSPFAPGQPAAAHGPDHRPIVFVHGSAGSAQQFQTQAKRLASNGYPIEIVEAHEYDSPNVATLIPSIYAGLDARIERLLAKTGADKVDLLGHSLGTFVSQGYLNSAPSRAARVAHYVNLDGRTAASLPGGVPTLAIWGEGDPARAVAGARNVYLPDQSHTQTVSSVESFREIFAFFTGRAPRVDRVVPTPVARISGRAVLFPSNVGVDGATLSVYQVGSLTGHRLFRVHRVALTGDGSFGPLPLLGSARYEFAIERTGAPTHHFYSQPFLRSDSFVRLLTSQPGEGLGALVETGDRHTALTINRQKEWWGGVDSLWINGRQVLNEAIAPRTKRVIGIFAFDAGRDGVTDLGAPLPAFFSQTFITGMDVFIPTGFLVSVVVGQRGGGYDILNVPAWRSSEHRVSLNIDDF
jgi:pimeloyl-ACP methyl ester carboxylesterase